MSNPEDSFPKRIEGKLNIYFHVSENSGVGYYRQYLQAVALREQGLANTMISDFRWGIGDHQEPNIPYLYDICNWVDIIVVGRRDQAQFYAQWGGIREYFNIPIVLDTDDNVRYVRPTNPGYLGYHPGSEAITWNKYGIAKVFDAITVSTDDLKEILQKENPKIYILPNSLDMKEWNKHPKPDFKDGILRIGFLASGAHSEGVNIIKKPILEIMKKHQNVKFYLTEIYLNQLADFPEDIKKRIESIPWFKLEDWMKGLKGLGLDIGLAPLADNMFNRAKSNLRWMELGACKVAPIVSPVKAYSCVTNNKNGIIAKEREDWFQAMDRLITDEKLRYNISNEAYKEVSTKFDIDKNVVLFEKIYREIHDKFHEFFGKKKHWIKLNKKGKYRLVN